MKSAHSHEITPRPRTVQNLDPMMFVALKVCWSLTNTYKRRLSLRHGLLRHSKHG